MINYFLCVDFPCIGTRSHDAYQIFGVDQVPFSRLPDLVNRHLAPPDPVLLYYTVDPTMPSPERPMAWDIEVKVEDTSMKSRMTVLVQANKESSQTLSKLDEEVGARSIGIDLL